MVKIVKASEYQVASVKKGTSDKLQKDLFWMRFVSPKHQEMLVNMNETEADIIQWSKKRVLYCSVFALFGLMILMFHMFGKLGFQVGIGLIIFALIYYFIHGNSINSQYKEYRFLQQVEFSKFQSIIIPFLLNENQYSLFAAMQKVDKCLENSARPIMSNNQRDKEKKKLLKNKNQPMEHTRKEWMRRISIQYEVGEKESKVMQQSHLNLKRLMVRMRDDSTDITPYIEFAEQSSGAEEARTFMESLFYFSQSSSDSSVIRELSAMSNKQMFVVVDEVIKSKIKKISSIPTIITVLVVLPLFGVLGSYVVSMLTMVLKNF